MENVTSTMETISGSLCEFRRLTVPLDLNSLTIENEKEKYVFDLKDDVTPLESAKLSFLWFSGSFSSHNRNSLNMYDYVGFLKEHKLERHFIKKTL